MELKSTKPIGKMAVVIDEANDLSEVVPLDTLRMLLFGINYCPGAAVGKQTGNMQFSFAWGGYDSQGNFHVDPRRTAANKTINSDVDGERELWQATAFDEKGNPIKFFDFDFFHRLFFDVPILGKPFIGWVVDGGWKFEEIEITCEGHCVYKKEKKKD